MIGGPVTKIDGKNTHTHAHKHAHKHTHTNTHTHRRTFNRVMFLLHRLSAVLDSHFGRAAGSPSVSLVVYIFLTHTVCHISHHREFLKPRSEG